MGGHYNAGCLGHLLQERAPYDGAVAGLHIVTLGGFAIALDGEHIDTARWGRPKVQQLFKYLLTVRNHCAHRDVLMDALWPELPVDAAWSNLKNAIYRLRRVLEPQLLPRQASRFLVAEGASYRLLLGPQDRWDAAEFLRQAEAAQRSRRDEHFAAAAALYGGEYLPDDIYEDWTIALRERLRSTYERLLLAWGEALAGRGACVQAIEVTEHLLHLDPSLETAHHALMRYYCVAGWRDRAVQQYRRCVTALQRELGIEPGPETQELYHRILHSQADGRAE
ncbi:MAG TPA: BTAD domain-containing putative transcriptional regulator [Chloroflexota bacterium]|nr:BTAD domain-containing putative transcriptional regulator [Chloroflexota bacterium]